MLIQVLVFGFLMIFFAFSFPPSTVFCKIAYFSNVFNFLLWIEYIGIISFYIHSRKSKIHLMKTDTQEVQWLNSIRVFATFSVIFLHVTAPMLYQFGSVPEFYWIIGNIYDSLVRFCVPIFLMISGALILPRIGSISNFFKKRVSRIFFPFMFWSLLYVAFNLSVSLENKNIFIYILTQLRDGASFHLWYIYLIIGMYLFFPVLGKWVVNAEKNEILYFIVIWLLVILFSIPMLSKFKPNITLNYFAGYIGYPILGYYLANFAAHKNIKLVSVLLIVIGTLATIIGTHIETKAKGSFVVFYYEYLSLNVLMTSVGMFLFFRFFEFQNKKITAIVNFVGTYSYGIYLSHILVLSFLNMFIKWHIINPIIGLPLKSLVCFIISLFVVYLINKIPYGKYVSG